MTSPGQNEQLALVADKVRRAKVRTPAGPAAVDPVARDLHIVTGSVAAGRVDDRTCALAALTMTSAFSAGDLVGGIRDGVTLLANHGRQGAVRHLDTV